MDLSFDVWFPICVLVGSAVVSGILLRAANALVRASLLASACDGPFLALSLRGALLLGLFLMLVHGGLFFALASLIWRDDEGDAHYIVMAIFLVALTFPIPFSAAVLSECLLTSYWRGLLVSLCWSLLTGFTLLTTIAIFHAILRSI